MPFPDSIKYYITRGSVRGQCSHKHNTMKGAIKCLDMDCKGCASQGGYSDRRIMAVHASGNVTGPYYGDE